MIPFHPYLNTRLWKDIMPKPVDTEEKAKKALKRDFNFSYDKKNQLYEYKGRQIGEKKAINYVIENSLSELKEYLMEFWKENEYGYW